MPSENRVLQASAKTPHRRRRKATATPVRKSFAENKENVLGYELDDRDVRFSEDDGAIRRKMACTPQKSVLKAKKNRSVPSEETELFQAVQDFKAAQLSLSDGSLFQTNDLSSSTESSDLAENVVRASLYPQSTVGLWHIQQHVSPLLNHARKLIKITSSGDGRNPEQVYHLLHAALHCIRAVLALPDDNYDNGSQRDSCIRLLYHLIIGSSRVTSEEKSKQQHTEINIGQLSALLGIAAYESLQQCLLQCTCAFKDGYHVRFRWNKSNVLPVLERRTTEPSTISSMDFRQITTTMLQTTLCVAGNILALWESHERLEKSTGMRLEETGGTFGSVVAHFLRQKTEYDAALYPFQRHILSLLRECYFRWVIFLSDSGDEEGIQDLSDHCKVGHRKFWDIASKCKELIHLRTQALTQNEQVDTSPIESFCLKLRGYAIELLMVSSGPTSNLESSCTYAWKAAIVYTQQSSISQFPVEPSNALMEFHTQIGSSLDRQRLQGGPIPTSYVEYCFYRALHCGYLSEMIPRNFYENDETIESVILQVALTAIASTHYLSSNLTGYTEKRKPPCDETLEALVALFDSKVLSRWNDMTNDVQNRYHKLFSILALNRTIFQTLKKETLNDGDKVHLRVVSVLLEKCMGPLTDKVLKACVDQNKMTSLYETMLESYIRPLMAFERLSQLYGDDTTKLRMLKLADTTIREMYQRFLGEFDLIPPGILERCAKALSLVAKQRGERSNLEDSIIPTLYSIPIYQHLYKSSSRDYHIPARLVHLATALMSAHMYNHAMLIFASLLVVEIPNSYMSVQEDLRKIDLFYFLAARSKHVFFPLPLTQQLSSLAKSSLRKLLVLFIEPCNRALNLKPDKIDDDPLERAWISFLGKGTGNESACTYWGDFCLKDSGVSALFRAVIHWLRPNQISSEALANRLLLLHVDAIVELGDVLMRNPRSESEGGRISKLLFEDLIEGFLACSHFNCTSLGAAIRIVASVSLAPYKSIHCINVGNTHWPEDAYSCKNQSIQFAQIAHSELDIRSGEENPEFCSLTAVALYMCYFFDSRSGDIAIQDCFELFTTAVKSIKKWDSRIEMANFYRQTLFWNMVHLLIHLQQDGDSLRASLTLRWMLLYLAEEGSQVEWCRSQALANPSSPFFLVESKDLEQISGPLEWLDRSLTMDSMSVVETFLSTTRARIRVDLPADRVGAYSSISVLKHQIEEEDSMQGDKIFNLFHTWLLCGVELTLAELAASLSLFKEALDHLKGSGRHCQTIFVASKRSIYLNLESSLVENASLATILHKANLRYSEILTLRSKVYQQIGDHRKAVSYLISLAQFLGVEFEGIDTKHDPNVKELYSITSSLNERGFRRTNAIIRCSASALDKVLEGVERNPIHLENTFFAESIDASETLEGILDVISVGDLAYGESINSPFQKYSSKIFNEAIAWYEGPARSNRIVKEYLLLSGEDNGAMSSTIAIRKVRCLLQGKAQQETRSEVERLCEYVLEQQLSEATDKAWALFYLASLHIAEARHNGDLQYLWSMQSDLSPANHSEYLRSAKDNLLQALSIHTLGSDILSRSILRSLALISGNEHGEIHTLCTGMLVLLSIGQSFQQIMVRSLSESIQESETERSRLHYIELFGSSAILQESNDHGLIDFLDKLAEVAPVNWKYTACAICPSGDLLLTSLEKDMNGSMALNTKCIVSGSERSAYDDILAPLDEIISESQNQLYGMNVQAVSEKFNEDSLKKAWWEKRHDLDESLETLLQQVEKTYFSSMDIHSTAEQSIFDSFEYPIDNLASKFEAAINEPLISRVDDTDSLKKLTVPKLKERLCHEFGYTDSKLRRVRKHDLIELIIQETTVQRKYTTKKTISAKGCLFLILDENLHRFPFEGLPCLTGRTVCRVPSLPFILASLLESAEQDKEVPIVSSKNASFVLDPENNLIATRNRLIPILDGFSSREGWEWSSVVGKMPTASFFEKGLCQKNGLFLYFGHGGAQKCFSRRQVEGLMNKGKDEGARSCKATVILMGCSSGRLVSVNRRNSKVLKEIPLHYEPEGIALSYLCAGSPCVVGNLWDVTDHDIDRFSTTLLEGFLDTECLGQGKESHSLAAYVAESRSSCKLPYIVGCAPVCYGVPVHLVHE